MGFLAGQRITANRFPDRKATHTDATNADFTTPETVIDQVTAGNLIVGDTYSVFYRAAFSSSVNADEVRARLREDDETGPLLVSERFIVPLFARTHTYVVYREFVAASTSQTFIITGERTAGTGTITRRALDAPAYLAVDKL